MRVSQRPSTKFTEVANSPPSLSSLKLKACLYDTVTVDRCDGAAIGVEADVIFKVTGERRDLAAAKFRR